MHFQKLWKIIWKTNLKNNLKGFSNNIIVKMTKHPKYVTQSVTNLKAYFRARKMKCKIKVQKIPTLSMYRIFLSVPGWKSLGQSQTQNLAEKIAFKNVELNKSRKIFIHRAYEKFK